MLQAAKIIISTQDNLIAMNSNNLSTRPTQSQGLVGIIVFAHVVRPSVTAFQI